MIEIVLLGTVGILQIIHYVSKSAAMQTLG